MKKVILLLVILAQVLITGYSIEGIKAKLVVEITDIKNDSGTVRIHLYDLNRKCNFPIKTENCLTYSVVKIQNGRAVAIFDSLKYGIYALSVHHDENSNELMDKTLFGFPSEGWGISNNIKVIMRVPDFEECSFKLYNNFNRISVKMNY